MQLDKRSQTTGKLTKNKITIITFLLHLGRLAFTPVPLHVNDQVPSPSSPGSAKSSTATRSLGADAFYIFEPRATANLAPRISANQVTRDSSCGPLLDAHNNTAT